MIQIQINLGEDLPKILDDILNFIPKDDYRLNIDGDFINNKMELKALHGRLKNVLDFLEESNIKKFNLWLSYRDIILLKELKENRIEKACNY